MGRIKRADAAGAIYHMLNRGNRRATIFEKDADYEAFDHILGDAVKKFEIDLFSYCVLSNHWHLVVRPKVDGEMSRFAQWLTLTHTQRYHAHNHSAGEGHLYQGRFKSFPVQEDDHFLTVNRYVERNAFSANLCSSPELRDSEAYGDGSTGRPSRSRCSLPGRFRGDRTGLTGYEWRCRKRSWSY